MLLKTLQWHGQHKFQLKGQRRIALTQLSMTTHLSVAERRKYEQLFIEDMKKEMIAIKSQTTSALDGDVVVTGVLPVNGVDADEGL